MKIIFIIAIYLLIVSTIIIGFGVITKWKFSCKKKNNYKPTALALLQKGVENNPEYSSLGNTLGAYFLKNKNMRSDQTWCSFFCRDQTYFNDTEIKAYIKNIKNAMPLIKKELSKIKPDKSVKNDTVIHIRCGDVPFIRCSDYYLQPKAYYKWIADKCKRENIKAVHFLLCSNHHQNKKHLKNKCNEFAQTIRTWMKEFLPRVEMKPVICENILKSFQMFIGCKLLAQGGSCPSSFSFFPGLLKGKNFLTSKFISKNSKQKSKLLDKFINKFPWTMWYGEPIWHSNVDDYMTFDYEKYDNIEKFIKIRNAYLLSTNFSSPRTIFSKNILERIGFKVNLIKALKHREPVISNLISMQYIYKIISQSNDNWAYIFEDDINLLKNISLEEIIAYENISDKIIYLGLCRYSNNNFVKKTNYTINNFPVYQISGNVSGLHAIGLSKNGAKELLEFSNLSGHASASGLIYMDNILEKFVKKNPANIIRYDLESSIKGHRGIFFQDRKKFPSIVSTQV